MKTLLITGFEPFGGETINPAWEAVKALPEQIGGWQLRKLQIPTVFSLAAQERLAARRSAAGCGPVHRAGGNAQRRDAGICRHQPAPRAHSGQPWKSAAGRACRARRPHRLLCNGPGARP